MVDVKKLLLCNICCMERKSNFFITTLDASAAFDRINIYGMLSKLIKLKIHFYIIHLLLSWYSNFGAQVKWAGELSSFFQIKINVRQSGLASAFLFTVYVDDLLCESNKEELGCYLSDMWLGALMYADDLILILGSVKKLQCMLNKCSAFGLKMDIAFNVKNSFYFCTDFNTKIDLKINGAELPWTGLSLNYLRVELGVKQQKLCVISDKCITKFTNAAMNVYRNTEHLPVSVRIELIQRKCVPMLMDGISAGFICNQYKNLLRIVYRNIFHYIFKMSHYSPISEIMFYCVVSSFELLLNKACLFMYA